MTTNVMRTTGESTTTAGEKTTVEGTTIGGMITTAATRTMIVTRTTVVTTIARANTTRVLTNGMGGETKGTTDKTNTSRKTCANRGGDLPTTTVGGHATHGRNHQDHRSNTNDNWCPSHRQTHTEVSQVSIVSIARNRATTRPNAHIKKKGNNWRSIKSMSRCSSSRPEARKK